MNLDLHYAILKSKQALTKHGDHNQRIMATGPMGRVVQVGRVAQMKLQIN